jgi:hypothetical protein
MRTEDKMDASGNINREMVVEKLAKINGITKESAEALYKIGIYSYADLVNFMDEYSVEEISRAFKEQGVNRSPGFISRYDWHDEANKKMQEEETTPPLIVEESTIANTSMERQIPSNSNDNEKTFNVSFDMVINDEGKQLLRTTIYIPDETEKVYGDDKIFYGNDPTPWVRYLLERADLPSELVPEFIEARTSVNQVMVKTNDVQLEISNVEVSEVGPSLDLPEKRLQAEVSFHIFGADAEKITAKSVPFRIEVHTVDLEKSSSVLAASAGSELKSEEFKYTRQLKFPIPDLGRYEIHTIVLLLPPGERMTSRVGPIVNVKP